MNLELAYRDIEAMGVRIDRLVTVVEGLADIAQNHERRLSRLEGGPQ